MSIFDVSQVTGDSDVFRRVLLTVTQSQIVKMTLLDGVDFGVEVQEGDLVLYFAEGEGEAILEGERSPVRAGSLAFVVAGTRHNFVNTGSGPLRLITIYAPAEHPDGTVHETKADADAAEEH